MKLNFIFLLLTLSLHSFLVEAQPPAHIPYQAIARDAAGNAVLNQNIGLRFSIHDQTITGTVVWQEAQTVLSGPLGVVVTSLGSVSDLSTVNWAQGDKFLQVEMDITGGTNYSDMGTQQMMSVPYALYAGQAGQANQVGGSSLSLGDSHAGGILVYLDQTGQHGFVMADSVFSPIGLTLGYAPYSFSCGGTPVVTSESLGSGEINTLSLLEFNQNSNSDLTNTLLQFVTSSSFDGYDDWFIPSRDELRSIYFNVYKPGVYAMPEGTYVSSSVHLQLNFAYQSPSQQQSTSWYADGVSFSPQGSVWYGGLPNSGFWSCYDIDAMLAGSFTKFIMIRKF
jgi:hypothetical protein